MYSVLLFSGIHCTLYVHVPVRELHISTYLVGSNMLSSMIQGVGRGIDTGVVIACCTPTAGAGTPGTDRPANNDMLCELKSNLRIVVYFNV